MRDSGQLEERVDQTLSLKRACAPAKLGQHHGRMADDERALHVRQGVLGQSSLLLAVILAYIHYHSSRHTKISRRGRVDVTLTAPPFSSVQV